jgi:hypothetical protein
MTTRDDAGDDGLSAWLTDLRARLSHGDMVQQAPIDLGYGTGRLPGATTIQVMLADLDHLDDLPRHAWEWVDMPWRRVRLLDDFRRLRALIG